MRYIFTFLLTILSLSVPAQNTYQKIISNVGPGSAIYQTDDNKILISSANNWSSILLKLDEQGNVIWRKDYTEFFSSGARDIIQMHDGSYLLSIQLSDFDNLQTLVMLKTDTSGNILSQRKFENSTLDNFSSWNVHQAPNGYIYILGSTDYFQCAQRVVCVNQNLDLVWSKSICSTATNYYAYSATVMSNSDLYLSLARSLDTLSVYKIDTTGNLYSTVNVALHPFASPHAYITRLPGDGYAVSATISYNSRRKQTLFVFDASDNLLVSKILDTTHVQSSNTMELNPVLSTDNYLFIPSFKHSYTFKMFKTDLSGNILWAKQKVLTPLSVQDIAEIKPTSDSGFAAVITNTGISNIIVKSNADFDMGCIQPFNHYDSLMNYTAIVLPGPSFPDHPMDTFPSFFSMNNTAGMTTNECFSTHAYTLESYSDNVELYPNPAGNELRLRFGKHKNMQVEFFTISGHKAHEVFISDHTNELINIQYLKEGFYFVKVTAEGSTVTGKLVVNR